MIRKARQGAPGSRHRKPHVSMIQNQKIKGGIFMFQIIQISEHMFAAIAADGIVVCAAANFEAAVEQAQRILGIE